MSFFDAPMIADENFDEWRGGLDMDELWMVSAEKFHLTRRDSKMECLFPNNCNQSLTLKNPCYGNFPFILF